MAKHPSPPRPAPAPEDAAQVKKEGRALVAGLSTGWSAEAKQLVSTAVEAGCKARKTSDGRHVLLIHPNGQSATVSPAGMARGDRSHKNNTSAVNALIGRKKNGNGDGAAVQDDVPAPAPAAAEAPADPKTRDEALAQLKEYRCTLCKPARQLLNAEALEAHRREVHVQCDWVDPVTQKVCGQWVKAPRSVGPHKSTAHGTNKPWEHRTAWKTAAEKEAEKARPPVPQAAAFVEPALPTAEAKTAAEQLAAQPVQDTTPARSTADNLKPPVPDSPPVAPPPTERRKRKGTLRRVETPVADLPEAVGPPVLPQPLAEPGTLREQHYVGYVAIQQLEAIRKVLGRDPVIDQLTAQLAVEKQRADTAEAKLELTRNALRSAQEAMEL